MGAFIELTALTRNNLPFTKSILVDVNKIVNPIIENSNGEAIIEVDTNFYYNEDHGNLIEKYTVSEDLTAIAALTDEIFRGSIIKYKGRDPKVFNDALFVKSRVMGIVTSVALGSEFRYRIMSSQSPEAYIIEESLATINA